MKKIRSSTACAWFLCGALEISATFGLSSPALADEASDAREGEALATNICSDCHVVSPKVGPPGKGLRRKDFSGPLSPIRTVRNRIAHHEPIITWDSPEAPRQNG
jgi:mono/diheme cytochrome c family protein